MQPKTGLLTTEFWVTVLSSVWVMVQPELDALIKAALPVGAGAIYTIVRGLIKMKS